MKSSPATLAAKLRLTALALCCNSRKEFCARFAGVNPRTTFTPQNAYTWMQGRSLPRVPTLYQDWAAVLGGGLTPTFLAAASYRDFAAALQAHHTLPETSVAAFDPSPDAPASAGGALLIGHYLTISPAWSSTEIGNLVIGNAEIRANDRGGLEICYAARLFGQPIRRLGTLTCEDRTAQSAMVCDKTGRLMFISLHLPTGPADIIGGMLTGPVVHDQDARIKASRTVLVRNRLAGHAAERCRFAAMTGGTVEGELDAMGYRAGVAAAAARILAFLNQPPPGPVFEVLPDLVGGADTI